MKYISTSEIAFEHTSFQNRKLSSFYFGIMIEKDWMHRRRIKTMASVSYSKLFSGLAVRSTFESLYIILT